MRDRWVVHSRGRPGGPGAAGGWEKKNAEPEDRDLAARKMNLRSLYSAEWVGGD